MIVYGLLRGPMCNLIESVITLQCTDLFGCQYECSNVLTCDELVCASGHYLA